MAKFKVGDRVRVIYTPGESDIFKKEYAGKEYVINDVDVEYFDGVLRYSLTGEPTFWWFENDLELVKEK